MMNKKLTLNNCLAPNYNNFETNNGYLKKFNNNRKKSIDLYNKLIKKNKNLISTKIIFVTINKEISKSNFKNFLRLIKSFENNKKIYNFYCKKTFKPINKNYYSNIENYILFAKSLIRAYHKKKNLIFANSLFKVIDIITLQKNIFHEIQLLKQIIFLIQNEKKIIKQISKK